MGRVRVKKKKETEHVSHGLTVQCVDALLVYLDLWGFQYIHVTTTQKIQIVRNPNSLQT
jgi:hypothetical protein